MKLAIASDDGVHVAQHFGRASGFVIVTLQDGENGREFIENRSTAHHRVGHAHADHGSHGHAAHAAQPGHSHAALLETLRDCGLVVSGGMGRRLQEDFRGAGIIAMVTDIDLVDDVVREARSGMIVHHADRSCGHH